jgi:ribose 5-phosphate isomerase B
VPRKVIHIGSDHAGFELKRTLSSYLESHGVTVHDDGPREYDPDDDYPVYAQRVCRDVLAGKALGILICGTGQGMDIAANKMKGIYATVAWDEKTATTAREHDGVNVLCLASRVTKPDAAKRIVSLWLNAEPARAGRHLRRINEIKRMERQNFKRAR